MKSLLFILFSFVIISESQSQWAPPAPNIFANCFAVNGNRLYSAKNGVGVSTNWGQSWTIFDGGPPTYEVRDLIYKDGRLFVAYEGAGVWYTSNEGVTWQQSPGIFPWQLTRKFAKGPNNYLYVGTDIGVYVSFNNGDSWDLTGLSSTNVTNLTASSSRLYAALEFGGVRTSSDGGATWVDVTAGLNTAEKYNLCIKDNYVFAATKYGLIYRSSNNGTNWALCNDSLPTTDNFINSFEVVGNTLLIGCSWGVYYTTNNGTTWRQFNTGMPAGSIMTDRGDGLINTGQYLFAAANNGIYRRDANQVVDVRQTSQSIPGAFKLDQNYPNPFNPVTTINYHLSANADVKLNVFDITGRELALLVNQKQNAGSYQVNFDASKLSTGVYYYTLSIGDFKETKKMMLIK